MNYEQAEEILAYRNPTVLSPTLRNPPSLTLRRSSSPATIFSRRASTFSNTATVPASFPLPESRSSSADSSFGFRMDFGGVQMLPNLAFLTQAPLTPHLVSPLSPVNSEQSRIAMSPTTEILLQTLLKEPLPVHSNTADVTSDRQRTRLTREQREYMMRIFEVDNNPPSHVIRQVAEKVGMRFRLVQYFYQNRRAARRRKNAAAQFKEE
ncbi:UNVERIFIED_CONTAM: hypothetical protein HDU68_009079 [Siphonaria sp. JEL0065]|nr:hypothetical protein HDU68_009079 [Siphonaria sp. JEL0065]